MLKTIILATLASTAMTNTPTLQFSKDSVYLNNNIIACEVLEFHNEKVIPAEEEGAEDVVIDEVTKLLSLKENHLLGYTIYDNPDTAYIDGLKLDDEWVYDWVVENYDDSIEHTLKIKTVYTDDVAGMMMAAKDGDWSRILSNPLIIIQLIYYTIAAIGLAVGLIFGSKNKGKAIKTVNQFSSEIDNIFTTKVDVLSEHIEGAVVAYVENLINPILEKQDQHNKDLVSALILSQSGDEKSKLALIDLLKVSAKEDVNLISEQIKKSIKDANLAKALIKTNAENTIKEIANGTFVEQPKPAVEPEDDGTTI